MFKTIKLISLERLKTSIRPKLKPLQTILKKLSRKSNFDESWIYPYNPEREIAKLIAPSEVFNIKVKNSIHGYNDLCSALIMRQTTKEQEGYQRSYTIYAPVQYSNLMLSCKKHSQHRQHKKCEAFKSLCLARFNHFKKCFKNIQAMISF